MDQSPRLTTDTSQVQILSAKPYSRIVNILRLASLRGFWLSKRPGQQQVNKTTRAVTRVRVRSAHPHLRRGWWQLLTQLLHADLARLCQRQCRHLAQAWLAGLWGAGAHRTCQPEPCRVCRRPVGVRCAAIALIFRPALTLAVGFGGRDVAGRPGQAAGVAPSAPGQKSRDNGQGAHIRSALAAAVRQSDDQCHWGASDCKLRTRLQTVM